MIKTGSLRWFSFPLLNNEKVMLTFISFVAVIFTLVLTLIACLNGNELALWSRFFSYFIDAFLLFFSFLTAKINHSRSHVLFEFGLGKVDAFSGILLSAMVTLYVAAMLLLVFLRILDPTYLTANVFGCILYAFFILKDFTLYYRFHRYTRHQRSPLISSQRRYYLTSLCFNVIVLTPLMIIFLLPQSHIPMVVDLLAALCICFLTVYLSYGVGKRAAFDLIDKALDEAIQLQILRFLAKHYDAYEQFHGQLTRQSGNTKYIHLFFEFSPKKPFAEIMQTIDILQTDLQVTIPESRVFIIPATQKVR